MPKTLFGFPVIEVDVPEMDDRIILCTDWRRWSGIINLKFVSDDTLKPDWDEYFGYGDSVVESKQKGK